MQFNLPAGLIDSVCYVETKHDTTVINHNDGATDSLGICQVKLETAQWLGFTGTYEQLMEPKVNIYYAAKYLARNVKRYGSYEKAVIAYNKGHAGAEVTTAYSQKVFNQWRLATND